MGARRLHAMDAAHRHHARPIVGVTGLIA